MSGALQLVWPFAEASTQLQTRGYENRSRLVRSTSFLLQLADGMLLLTFGGLAPCDAATS